MYQNSSYNKEKSRRHATHEELICIWVGEVNGNAGYTTKSHKANTIITIRIDNETVWLSIWEPSKDNSIYAESLFSQLKPNHYFQTQSLYYIVINLVHKTLFHSTFLFFKHSSTHFYFKWLQITLTSKTKFLKCAQPLAYHNLTIKSTILKTMQACSYNQSNPNLRKKGWIFMKGRSNRTHTSWNNWKQVWNKVNATDNKTLDISAETFWNICEKTFFAEGPHILPHYHIPVKTLSHISCLCT